MFTCVNNNRAEEADRGAVHSVRELKKDKEGCVPWRAVQVCTFSTQTWKNEKRSSRCGRMVRFSTADSDTESGADGRLKLQRHFAAFSLFTLSLHNGNKEARLFLVYPSSVKAAACYTPALCLLFNYLT